MEKIASISKNNAAPTASRIRMRGREIIVLPYYWGIGKKRTLRNVYRDGIRIAAVDETARLRVPAAAPVLTVNGKLLKIALLPQILDQNKIAFREETIAVNCDTLAGFMSALTLAQETRHLVIRGYRAREIEAYLFREYGLITMRAPATFDLEDMSWHGRIIANDQILSPPLAEALLVAVSAESPALTPAYLFSLARRAAYYGFAVADTATVCFPSKTAAPYGVPPSPDIPRTRRRFPHN